MKKAKNVVCLLAVFMMCLACVDTAAVYSFSFQGKPLQSESEVSGEFYYNQLDELSKKFYNIIDDMNTSGIMKTGTGSVDLVAKGYLTSDTIKDFINGNSALGVAFQNARDAYEKDVVNVFYVDFTKLTLRVGKMGDSYAAFIGSGSNSNYYARGFASLEQVNNAITATELARNAIVNKVKISYPNTIISGDKIVTAVHNELVNKLSYTYPDDNHLFVAGIYSISSGGFANCVGYSTLLKYILNALEIKCVLVAGDAINSKQVTELHMWNYVQIENQWYAVDVTWDDPITVTKSTEEIRSDYLLIGSSEFTINHFELGVFSPNGMTFKYPELREQSFGIVMKLSDESTDIKLYTEKFIDEEGIVHTGVTVNYFNKSLKELKAEGLFLAARYWYANKTVAEPWVALDAYVSENNKYNQLVISKEGFVQFCITKLDSKDLKYSQDLSLPQNNEVIATFFRVPYYDSYVAPPFIRKSNPFLGKCILPEPRHFEVEFDEELIVEDPTKDISILVGSTQSLEGKVTNLETKFGSFTLPDGVRRVSTIVSFDFEPDTSYQSYINKYSLQLKNLIGKGSKKAPNPIPINVTFRMSVPCPVYVGKGTADAFVIGLPTLVVNDKLDIFEYNGQSAATNPLDIRLVASIPNDKQKESILAASGQDEILSSAVYDLSLSCRDYVAKLKSDTNYNVTIGLPYPEGFNYNDNKNVQFKAYHYRKQNDGTFIAEQLICRITEKGLEVLAKDFSPFTIVAVPKTEQIESMYKFASVEVMTQGGNVLKTVENANLLNSQISAVGVTALQSGESTTFTIEANQNYVIEKVLVNNVITEIKDNTISLEYQSMSADVSIKVYFIDKEMLENDKKIGFESVTPQLNWTGKKLQISSGSFKFEDKIFNYNKKKPNQIFEMTVSGLNNDYKVDYKNNKASKIGSYIAEATIFKLQADGVTLDERYDSLTLKANYSVVNLNKSNTIMIVIICLASAVVVSGAVLAFVLIAKRKKA